MTYIISLLTVVAVSEYSQPIQLHVPGEGETGPFFETDGEENGEETIGSNPFHSSSYPVDDLRDTSHYDKRDDVEQPDRSEEDLDKKAEEFDSKKLGGKTIRANPEMWKLKFACDDSSSEVKCREIAVCKWEKRILSRNTCELNTCDDLSEVECKNNALVCKWDNRKCKPQNKKTRKEISQKCTNMMEQGYCKDTNFRLTEKVRKTCGKAFFDFCTMKENSRRICDRLLEEDWVNNPEKRKEAIQKCGEPFVVNYLSYLSRQLY